MGSQLQILGAGGVGVALQRYTWLVSDLFSYWRCSLQEFLGSGLEGDERALLVGDARGANVRKC